MNAFKNLINILGLEKIRVLYLALIKSIIDFSISIWRGRHVQHEYKVNKKIIYICKLISK